ncbi:MAG TPA: hypothetical protein VF070_03605, partial [Streptosporangiaceae bacterium]
MTRDPGGLSAAKRTASPLKESGQTARLPKGVSHLSGIVCRLGRIWQRFNLDRVCGVVGGPRPFYPLLGDLRLELDPVGLFARWETVRHQFPGLCLPGWPLLSGDAAIFVVDYRLVVSFPHYSPGNQPQGGKSLHE